MDGPRLMPSQLLRDDTLLPATREEVVQWLREQGAVDYDRAAELLHELRCEVAPNEPGTNDYGVAQAIIDTALSLTGQEGSG